MDLSRPEGDYQRVAEDPASTPQRALLHSLHSLRAAARPIHFPEVLGLGDEDLPVRLSRLSRLSLLRDLDEPELEVRWLLDVLDGDRAGVCARDEPSRSCLKLHAESEYLHFPRWKSMQSLRALHSCFCS